MGILITILIILLITILLLVVRSIQIKRRLRSLITIVNDIVSGNRNRRFHIQSNNQEIIDFSASLNRLMDQFEMYLDKVQRLEEERKQMISNISHDLRTPITAILGYAEALLEDQTLSEEEQRQYLSIISVKGANLSSLVQQFFELARVESQPKLKLEKINLTVWIKDLLVSFYREFKKEELTPVIDLPDGDLYALGEPKSIERIMQNLITNALKHGVEGKVIGISLKENQDWVLLEVWDQGRGIGTNDLPYIFDRLYTGEISRNRTFPGTGLGLTIVKILVEKLHGKIEVKSIPFERTSFVLSLRKM